MKTVYLILYLWHTQGSGGWHDCAQMGGPSMSIAPMPSLSVCEEVGRHAKELADQQGTRRSASLATGTLSEPAVYRCIEVASK